jgi:DNA-binding transcriptional LysR family regulator
MTMNPRHIDLFRDVVRYNGITRAAEALGIGQPFITRAIARLEADIGFALFVRGRGGVTLTPEGELFLQDVERSRAGLDYLIRSAREIRDRGAGTIRIACLPALTFDFIPRVLKSFSESHDGVTISLAVRSPETIWNWVASRQCDLGLARRKTGHAGVDFETFATVSAVCAIPRGHPLAGKKTISPEDLRNERMVAAPPSAPHQAEVDRIFAAAGVPMRIVMETEYTAPRCALVAQGLGVAIVDPAAARGIANPAVVLRSFVPEIPIETMLLFPSGRPKSKLTEQLVMILKSERGRLSN